MKEAKMRWLKANHLLMRKTQFLTIKLKG